MSVAGPSPRLSTTSTPRISSTFSLVAPFGNLARLARVSGDFPKALELEEKSLEMCELARKRSPQSPLLLEQRGIGYDNKARVLLELKQPDEATKCYEESVASFRSAAKENPVASRFQWLLADELRTGPRTSALAAITNRRRPVTRSHAKSSMHSRTELTTARCMAPP